LRRFTGEPIGIREALDNREGPADVESFVTDVDFVNWKVKRQHHRRSGGRVLVAGKPVWESRNHPNAAYNARVSRASAQFISQGVETVIEWDTCDWDTGGFFDPGSPTVLTFPEDGVYAIVGNIRWCIGTSDVRTRQAWLDHDGKTEEYIAWNTAYENGHPLCSVVRASAGDTIRLIVKHDVPMIQSVNSGSFLSVFSLQDGLPQRGALPEGGEEYMTNPMTSAGDMIIGSTGGAPGRLGIGSSGNILGVVGGAPSWLDYSERMLTPQQYGAVGDGSTDDTSAFQQMIAASNAMSSRAGIHIPRGNYKITRRLTPIVGTRGTLIASGNSLISYKGEIPSAPTAALAGEGAGSLGDGTYSYLVVFVYSDGESCGGFVVSCAVEHHDVDGKIRLTNIPISSDPLATDRHIYRTDKNGKFFFFLHAMGNNTSTEWVDDGTGALGDLLAGVVQFGQPGKTTQQWYVEKLGVSASDDGIMSLVQLHKCYRSVFVGCRASAPSSSYAGVATSGRIWQVYDSYILFIFGIYLVGGYDALVTGADNNNNVWYGGHAEGADRSGVWVPTGATTNAVAFYGFGIESVNPSGAGGVGWRIEHPPSVLVLDTCYSEANDIGVHFNFASAALNYQVWLRNCRFDTGTSGYGVVVEAPMRLFVEGCWGSGGKLLRINQPSAKVYLGHLKRNMMSSGVDTDLYTLDSGTVYPTTQDLSYGSYMLADGTWRVPHLVNGITKSLNGSSGTVTLTSSEYSYHYIEFTGAPSGAVVVVFPSTSSYQWLLRNSCTGAYATITVRTSSTTYSTSLQSGQQIKVMSDGTYLTPVAPSTTYRGDYYGRSYHSGYGLYGGQSSLATGELCVNPSDLEFEGTTSRITLGSAGSIPEISSVTTFSMSFWFMPYLVGDTSELFWCVVNSNNRIRIATSSSNLTVYIYNGSGSNNWYGYFNWSSLEQNVWHHIVIAVNLGGATNPDRMQIYVDGVAKTLSFSGTAPSQTADLSSAQPYISYSSNAWYGRIRDWRIWTSQLTAVNAASLYAGDDVGSPVHWWKIDEGSGVTIADSGSNPVTGTASTLCTWAGSGSFGVRRTFCRAAIHLKKDTSKYGGILFGEDVFLYRSGSSELCLSGALVPSVVRGSGLTLPHLVTKAASANVRNSHDAEASTTSTSYVKLKTITLTNGLLGQARFLFDIKTGSSPTTVYGRIYRNGVALGTEQSDTTGSYVTKSEDITQTWGPGDTAELWVRTTDAGVTAYVQNFRIAYDDAPTVAVASSNS
jgi:hypothetical protein